MACPICPKQSCLQEESSSVWEQAGLESVRVWADSRSLPHAFLNFLGGLTSSSFLVKKHFFTLVLFFLFLPLAIMEAWLIKIASKKM